jgi:response regulator RpfG family c-di-GMP phosphodiesterase
MLAGETAKRLNLPPKEILDLEMAALLHDLGTVSLPRKLMEAPFGDLTKEEIAFLKQHPVFAQNILSPLSELEKAGLIIRSHLERLDGSGFPEGLVDEQIPYGAKILGVVNAFDEIVSRRRFTLEKLDTDEAREEHAFKHLFGLSGKYYSRIITEALRDAVQRLNMKTRRMVKVALGDLRAGMVVARNIYTKDGTLLLARGFPMEKGIIRQISNFREMDLISDDFRVFE